MVSIVVRLAGSCVLPVAWPGPRRFGGGRLPAPGHHHRAGLLAAAGRGAVTSAGIDDGLLRPGKLLSTGASPWALKAAGQAPPSGAPGDDEEDRPEDDSELVLKFKVALMAAQLLPAEPANYMERPGIHDQVVFADLAERSFSLWVEVANRLRPPAYTFIDAGLHQSGEVFVAAMARKSAISWNRAREMVEGLELLRRIVSSALQAPLPLDWTWYAQDPEKYDSKDVFCTLLEHTCRAIENDIRFMLDDELTTN